MVRYYQDKMTVSSLELPLNCPCQQRHDTLPGREFDNTTPIYLINLPWKLGLGLWLDLHVKLHYFSIFHGE